MRGFKVKIKHWSIASACMIFDAMAVTRKLLKGLNSGWTSPTSCNVNQQSRTHGCTSQMEAFPCNLAMALAQVELWNVQTKNYTRMIDVQRKHLYTSFCYEVSIQKKNICSTNKFKAKQSNRVKTAYKSFLTFAKLLSCHSEKVVFVASHTYDDVHQGCKSHFGNCVSPKGH